MDRDLPLDMDEKEENEQRAVEEFQEGPRWDEARAYQEALKITYDWLRSRL